MNFRGFPMISARADVQRDEMILFKNYVDDGDDKRQRKKLYYQFLLSSIIWTII